MKRIPKSFQLGGNKWTVKLVDQEDIDEAAADTDVYGLCNYDTCTILLSKPTRKLKKSVVMQTFWHEYFHALLWTLSHKDYRNEKFVDQAGHAQKQFFDSLQF